MKILKILKEWSLTFISVWGTPRNCSNHGEITEVSSVYKDQIGTLEYLKFVKKLHPEKVKFLQ